MNVFGKDLAADIQLRVGKVPDAAHAKRDELLGNLLRDGFRHCQHSDIGVADGEIVAQLIKRTDEHVVYTCADERGRNIERGVEQKTGLRKVKVAQQRMTQVTGADDDKAVAFVHTEDVADLCAQVENVVAVALLAKFAEAAQVLTNLRGGDAHALAEQA